MSSTTSIAEGAQTAAELPVLRPCQPFQKRLLTTLSCDNEIRNILWACQETPDDMTPEVERILAQRSRVILISIWKQAAPNPLSFDFLHIFRTYNTQQLVQDILAAVKNPTKFGTIETWESTFQARIDRIRLRELVNVTYGVDTKVFGSLEELCREMWLCKSSLGGFARRVKAIQVRLPPFESLLHANSH